MTAGKKKILSITLCVILICAMALGAVGAVSLWGKTDNGGGVDNGVSLPIGNLPDNGAEYVPVTNSDFLTPKEPNLVNGVYEVRTAAEYAYMFRPRTVSDPENQSVRKWKADATFKLMNNFQIVDGNVAAWVIRDSGEGVTEDTKLYRNKFFDSNLDGNNMYVVWNNVSTDINVGAWGNATIRRTIGGFCGYLLGSVTNLNYMIADGAQIDTISDGGGTTPIILGGFCGHLKGSITNSTFKIDGNVSGGQLAADGANRNSYIGGVIGKAEANSTMNNNEIRVTGIVESNNRSGSASWAFVGGVFGTLAGTVGFNNNVVYVADDFKIGRGYVHNNAADNNDTKMSVRYAGLISGGMEVNSAAEAANNVTRLSGSGNRRVRINGSDTVIDRDLNNWKSEALQQGITYLTYTDQEKNIFAPLDIIGGSADAEDWYYTGGNGKLNLDDGQGGNVSVKAAGAGEFTSQNADTATVDLASVSAVRLESGFNYTDNSLTVNSLRSWNKSAAISIAWYNAAKCGGTFDVSALTNGKITDLAGMSAYRVLIRAQEPLTLSVEAKNWKYFAGTVEGTSGDINSANKLIFDGTRDSSVFGEFAGTMTKCNIEAVLTVEFKNSAHHANGAIFDTLSGTVSDCAINANTLLTITNYKGFWGGVDADSIEIDYNVRYGGFIGDAVNATIEGSLIKGNVTLNVTELKTSKSPIMSGLIGNAQGLTLRNNNIGISTTVAMPTGSNVLLYYIVGGVFGRVQDLDIESCRIELKQATNISYTQDVHFGVFAGQLNNVNAGVNSTMTVNNSYLKIYDSAVTLANSGAATRSRAAYVVGSTQGEADAAVLTMNNTVIDTRNNAVSLANATTNDKDFFVATSEAAGGVTFTKSNLWATNFGEGVLDTLSDLDKSGAGVNVAKLAAMSGVQPSIRVVDVEKADPRKGEFTTELFANVSFYANGVGGAPLLDTGEAQVVDALNDRIGVFLMSAADNANSSVKDIIKNSYSALSSYAQVGANNGFSLEKTLIYKDATGAETQNSAEGANTYYRTRYRVTPASGTTNNMFVFYFGYNKVASEAQWNAVSRLVNQGFVLPEKNIYIAKDFGVSVGIESFGTAIAFDHNLLGQGHTITIGDKSIKGNDLNAGLAAEIADSGSIRDLTVSGGVVYSRENGGIIAGINRGTIANVDILYKKANVSLNIDGNSSTFTFGMIAGANYGTISGVNVTATAIINGSQNTANSIGSIVGSMNGGTVEKVGVELGSSFAVTFGAGRGGSIAPAIGSMSGGTVKNNAVFAKRSVEGKLFIGSYSAGTLNASDNWVATPFGSLGTSIDSYKNITGAKAFVIGDASTQEQAKYVDINAVYDRLLDEVSFTVERADDFAIIGYTGTSQIKGSTAKLFTGGAHNAIFDADDYVSVQIISSTIKTIDDWKRLALAVNSGTSFKGTTFTLNANLTLDSSTPVVAGVENMYFEGSINGNGKTITFSAGTGEGGLFGTFGSPVVTGSTLYNIRIAVNTGTTFATLSGFNATGIIAGVNYGHIGGTNGEVRLMINGVTNITGAEYAGLAVGVNYGTVTGMNVNVNYFASFEGVTGAAGGLIGYNTSHAVLSNSHISYYTGNFPLFDTGAYSALAVGKSDSSQSIRSIVITLYALNAELPNVFTGNTGVSAANIWINNASGGDINAYADKYDGNTVSTMSSVCVDSAATKYNMLTQMSSLLANGSVIFNLNPVYKQNHSFFGWIDYSTGAHINMVGDSFVSYVNGYTARNVGAVYAKKSITSVEDLKKFDAYNASGFRISGLEFTLENNITIDADVWKNADGTPFALGGASAMKQVLTGNGKTVTVNLGAAADNDFTFIKEIGEQGGVKDLTLLYDKSSFAYAADANSDTTYKGLLADVNKGRIVSVNVTTTSSHTLDIANTSNTAAYLGGVVGYNSGLIAESVFSLTYASAAGVSYDGRLDSYAVGGICGYNVGYIEMCTYDGNGSGAAIRGYVTADTYIGGIAAVNAAVNNRGVVTKGYIFGNGTKNTDAVVNNYMTVGDGGYIGAIVGHNAGIDVTISGTTTRHYAEISGVSVIVKNVRPEGADALAEGEAAVYSAANVSFAGIAGLNEGIMGVPSTDKSIYIIPVYGSGTSALAEGYVSEIKGLTVEWNAPQNSGAHYDNVAGVTAHLAKGYAEYANVYVNGGMYAKGAAAMIAVDVDKSSSAGAGSGSISEVYRSNAYLNADGAIVAPEVAGVAVNYNGNIRDIEVSIGGALGGAGTRTATSFITNIGADNARIINIVINNGVKPTANEVYGFYNTIAANGTRTIGNVWFARNNLFAIETSPEPDTDGANVLRILGTSRLDYGYIGYDLTFTVETTSDAVIPYWYVNGNKAANNIGEISDGVSAIGTAGRKPSGSSGITFVPNTAATNTDLILSYHSLEIDNGDADADNDFGKFLTRIENDYYYNVEFKLNSDIAIEEGYSPIKNFNSHLNGMGHTITFVGDVAANNAGLFANMVDGATLSNTVIEVIGNIGGASTLYSGVVAASAGRANIRNVSIQYVTTYDEASNSYVVPTVTATTGKGAIVGSYTDALVLDNVWLVAQSGKYVTAEYKLPNGVNRLVKEGVYNVGVSLEGGCFVFTENADDNGEYNQFTQLRRENNQVVAEESGTDLAYSFKVPAEERNDTLYTWSMIKAEIGSLQELVMMRDNVIGFDCSAISFVLTNDIAIESGRFASIGNENNPFTSRLDGGGHKITVGSGVTIVGNGLFGTLSDGATIYNLNLEIATNNFDTSSMYIGGLVGVCDSSTVTKCTVKMLDAPDVSARKDVVYLGGIAGKFRGINDNVYLLTMRNGADGNLAAYGYKDGNFTDYFNTIYVAELETAAVRPTVTMNTDASGVTGFSLEHTGYKLIVNGAYKSDNNFNFTEYGGRKNDIYCVNADTDIATYDQFVQAVALINSGVLNIRGLEFKLVDDIEIYARDLQTSYAPIGSGDGNEFAATFNGDGKTISFLSDADRVFNIGGDKYAGVFGVIGATGVVKNLTVVYDGNIGASATQYAGILAGSNYGTVSNVAVVMSQFTKVSGVNTGNVVGYTNRDNDLATSWLFRLSAGQAYLARYGVNIMTVIGDVAERGAGDYGLNWFRSFALQMTDSGMTIAPHKGTGYYNYFLYRDIENGVPYTADCDINGYTGNDIYLSDSAYGANPVIKTGNIPAKDRVTVIDSTYASGGLKYTLSAPDLLLRDASDWLNLVSKINMQANMFDLVGATFTLFNDITIDANVLSSKNTDHLTPMINFKAILNGNGHTFKVSKGVEIRLDDEFSDNRAGVINYLDPRGEIKNIIFDFDAAITVRARIAPPADWVGGDYYSSPEYADAVKRATVYGGVIAQADGAINNSAFIYGKNARITTERVTVNGKSLPYYAENVGGIAGTFDGTSRNAWFVWNTSNKIDSHNNKKITRQFNELAVLGSVTPTIAFGAGNASLVFTKKDNGAFYSQGFAASDAREDSVSYAASNQLNTVIEYVPYLFDAVNNVFKITTSDLNNIGDDTGAGYDFSGKTLEISSSGSVAVRKTIDGFAGTLDGKGNTITIVASGSGGNKPLFGRQAGTVKDITFNIAGQYVFTDSAEDRAAGALVKNNEGNLTNLTVTLSNVAVSGDKNRYVGGIIGQNGGNIENCAFTVNSTAINTVNVYDTGVFVGYNEGTINAVTATAGKNVYAVMDGGSQKDMTLGGFIGTNKGTVNDLTLTFKGRMTSVAAANTHTNMGGIAGYLDSGSVLNYVRAELVAYTRTDGLGNTVISNEYQTAGLLYGQSDSQAVSRVAMLLTEGDEAHAFTFADFLTADRDYIDGASTISYNNVNVLRRDYDDCAAEVSSTNQTRYDGEGSLSYTLDQDSISVTAIANTGYVLNNWYTAEGEKVASNSNYGAITNNGSTFTSRSGVHSKWIRVVFMTPTIDNAEKLEDLANIVNKGTDVENVVFVLTQDITISGAFTPIGTREHPFNAAFDGNGHTITIEATARVNEAEFSGIFGYIGAKGILANVKAVNNASIGSVGGAASYSAVLAAYSAGVVDRGTFTDGDKSTWTPKTDQSSQVGAGSMQVVNNGAIYGGHSAAAVVAVVQSAEIANALGNVNAYNNASITAANYAGIISGRIIKGNVFNVVGVNSSTIRSDGYAGVIAGDANGNITSFEAKNNSAGAYIYGRQTAGGVVGSMLGSLTRGSVNFKNDGVYNSEVYAVASMGNSAVSNLNDVLIITDSKTEITNVRSEIFGGSIVDAERIAQERAKNIKVLRSDDLTIERIEDITLLSQGKIFRIVTDSLPENQFVDVQPRELLTESYRYTKNIDENYNISKDTGVVGSLELIFSATDKIKNGYSFVSYMEALEKNYKNIRNATVTLSGYVDMNGEWIKQYLGDIAVGKKKIPADFAGTVDGAGNTMRLAYSIFDGSGTFKNTQFLFDTETKQEGEIVAVTGLHAVNCVIRKEKFTRAGSTAVYDDYSYLIEREYLVNVNDHTNTFADTVLISNKRAGFDENNSGQLIVQPEGLNLRVYVGNVDVTTSYSANYTAGVNSWTISDTVRTGSGLYKGGYDSREETVAEYNSYYKYVFKTDVGNLQDMGDMFLMMNSGFGYDGVTLNVTAKELDLTSSGAGSIGTGSTTEFNGTFNGNGVIFTFHTGYDPLFHRLGAKAVLQNMVFKGDLDDNKALFVGTAAQGCRMKNIVVMSNKENAKYAEVANLIYDNFWFIFASAAQESDIGADINAITAMNGQVKYTDEEFYSLFEVTVDVENLTIGARMPEGATFAGYSVNVAAASEIHANKGANTNIADQTDASYYFDGSSVYKYLVSNIVTKSNNNVTHVRVILDLLQVSATVNDAAEWGALVDEIGGMSTAGSVISIANDIVLDNVTKTLSSRDGAVIDGNWRKIAINAITSGQHFIHDYVGTVRNLIVDISGSTTLTAYDVFGDLKGATIFENVYLITRNAKALPTDNEFTIVNIIDEEGSTTAVKWDGGPAAVIAAETGVAAGRTLNITNSDALRMITVDGEISAGSYGSILLGENTGSRIIELTATNYVKGQAAWDVFANALKDSANGYLNSLSLKLSGDVITVSDGFTTGAAINGLGCTLKLLGSNITFGKLSFVLLDANDPITVNVGDGSSDIFELRCDITVKGNVTDLMTIGNNPTHNVYIDTTKADYEILCDEDETGASMFHIMVTAKEGYVFLGFTDANGNYVDEPLYTQSAHYNVMVENSVIRSIEDYNRIVSVIGSGMTSVPTITLGANLTENGTLALAKAAAPVKIIANGYTVNLKTWTAGLFENVIFEGGHIYAETAEYSAEGATALKMAAGTANTAVIVTVDKGAELTLDTANGSGNTLTRVFNNGLAQNYVLWNNSGSRITYDIRTMYDSDYAAYYTDASGSLQPFKATLAHMSYDVKFYLEIYAETTLTKGNVTVSDASRSVTISKAPNFGAKVLVEYGEAVDITRNFDMSENYVFNSYHISDVRNNKVRTLGDCTKTVKFIVEQVTKNIYVKANVLDYTGRTLAVTDVYERGADNALAEDNIRTLISDYVKPGAVSIAFTYESNGLSAPSVTDAGVYDGRAVFTTADNEYLGCVKFTHTVEKKEIRYSDGFVRFDNTVYGRDAQGNALLAAAAVYDDGVLALLGLDLSTLGEVSFVYTNGNAGIGRRIAISLGGADRLDITETGAATANYYIAANTFDKAKEMKADIVPAVINYSISDISRIFNPANTNESVFKKLNAGSNAQRVDNLVNGGIVVFEKNADGSYANGFVPADISSIRLYADVAGSAVMLETGEYGTYADIRSANYTFVNSETYGRLIVTPVEFRISVAQSGSLTYGLMKNEADIDYIFSYTKSALNDNADGEAAASAALLTAMMSFRETDEIISYINGRYVVVKDAGTYAIDADKVYLNGIAYNGTTINPKNYNVTFDATGTYEIGRQKLTVNVSGNSSVYGTTPDVRVRLAAGSGFDNTRFALSAVLADGVDKYADARAYENAVSTLVTETATGRVVSDNFEIAYSKSGATTYTVTPRTVTVYIRNSSAVYGDGYEKALSGAFTYDDTYFYDEAGNRIDAEIVGTLSFVDVPDTLAVGSYKVVENGGIRLEGSKKGNFVLNFSYLYADKKNECATFTVEQMSFAPVIANDTETFEYGNMLETEYKVSFVRTDTGEDITEFIKEQGLKFNFDIMKGGKKVVTAYEYVVNEDGTAAVVNGYAEHKFDAGEYTVGNFVYEWEDPNGAAEGETYVNGNFKAVTASFVSPTLTVTQAHITISIGDLEKDYKARLSASKLNAKTKAEGLKFNDTVASLKLSFEWTEAVGTQTLSVSGMTNGNYVIDSVANGKVTISPKAYNVKIVSATVDKKKAVTTYSVDVNDGEDTLQFTVNTVDPDHMANVMSYLTGEEGGLDEVNYVIDIAASDIKLTVKEADNLLNYIALGGGGLLALIALCLIIAAVVLGKKKVVKSDLSFATESESKEAARALKGLAYARKADYKEKIKAMKKAKKSPDGYVADNFDEPAEAVMSIPDESAEPAKPKKEKKAKGKNAKKAEKAKEANEKDVIDIEDVD